MTINKAVQESWKSQDSYAVSQNWEWTDKPRGLWPVIIHRHASALLIVNHSMNMHLRAYVPEFGFTKNFCFSNGIGSSNTLKLRAVRLYARLVLGSRAVCPEATPGQLSLIVNQLSRVRLGHQPAKEPCPSRWVERGRQRRILGSIHRSRTSRPLCTPSFCCCIFVRHFLKHVRGCGIASFHLRRHRRNHSLFLCYNTTSSSVSCLSSTPAVYATVT